MKNNSDKQYVIAMETTCGLIKGKKYELVKTIGWEGALLLDIETNEEINLENVSFYFGFTRDKQQTNGKSL